MRTLRPPECKELTTLQVAVRCRPLTAVERLKCTEIARIVDDKVVVVSDTIGTRDTSDRNQSRYRERRYTFDHALGPQYRNKDVYERTVASMIKGVVEGLNATIFAYGATGSGKTYTMSGTAEDPGLMVLSLQDIFHLVSKEKAEYDFEVACSYLEVYNEVIYDLLEKSSGHLELREDPDQGIVVAGLKRIHVNSADKILELLHMGNSRRRTEKTDANFTSSRSHAVLEIIVRKYCRSHLEPQVLQGKVALVDLAGSERASETNSTGQKLRDGASINKSLLALANCINALGKQQKKGLAYVPYRNSKLTRILKDGLSGNSQTTMIATVSFGDEYYYHTINTLKYADRAKEIKTHVKKNIDTIDSHVADYQRMISNLQIEVSTLRKELAEKECQLNSQCTGSMQADELSLLNVLSHDISENVEDRINLQKALFELEDKNMLNHRELQQLDELIAKHEKDKDTRIVEAFSERRKLILDNIRDNDEVGAQYRQEIERNEFERKDLQSIIDKAISSDSNSTYLKILSQYRLMGITNTELQFQIAVRDHIIDNQRELLSNLWAVLKDSGLEEKHILDLASRHGMTIENWGTSSQIGYKPYKEGEYFSQEQPTSSSCETCKTLGHMQLTSLGSSHKCTNKYMGWPDHRKVGITMDSLKCEQQGFCSGRTENNYLSDTLSHTQKDRAYLPSWSSCRIIDYVDPAHSGMSSNMCMPLQVCESLLKATCKMCIEARERAKFRLSEANTCSKEEICINKSRQSLQANVLQCCCSSTTCICESQMKYFNVIRCCCSSTTCICESQMKYFNVIRCCCSSTSNMHESQMKYDKFHDMRGIDCCMSRCRLIDSCEFQKPFVENHQSVRRHSQHDKYRGQFCN